MMTPLAAARAYGAAIKQADTLGGGGGGEAVSAPDFGKMLQGAMEQTLKSTGQAEHMMIQQQAGQAELIDAVTAVSSAELQLQSVIAIRDQVISAYQEIMRMPI
ncbi:flagellar hook-basal body complex protein FliE [Asticcacaulis sp. AC402]|jgi:flagellar hook-basal body complex protein FliE|uniref:flagellar hook-basal body complex protein FliE n=1 Tax=Asticcacaulis sp. AC402 TaxID=1282361 RepID=UPI0003C3DBE3|nr:flagellar hook-basal body complex protein FliE [Asticcacaulis sp. AC402]ESQ74581.1 flagellar hook-basal body protein FliE [Asticcacaulis sp. AC402]